MTPAAATTPVETPAPVQTTAPAETAGPVEMQAAPQRSASDAYDFAAVLCAVVGIIIPIVPAAAALMLVRATDEDLTHEPLRPGLQQLAGFARVLAWFDLAWMTLATVAFLLGTLGRVIS
jgi:hypothetical protein